MIAFPVYDLLVEYFVGHVCVFNIILYFFLQLYTVQNIIRKEHVIPVRHFAQESAPKGLKGDGELQISHLPIAAILSLSFLSCSKLKKAIIFLNDNLHVFFSTSF